MNQNETDKIDRYLSNEMSSQEREAFERELQNSDALRNALSLQQDIYHGIDFHFQSDLKNRLKREDKSDILPRQQKNGGQRWLPVLQGVAASLVILLGAVYWYNSSEVSPTDLYYANYQPYPNIINPVERSGTAPKDLMTRAMQAYERENYDIAIALFEQRAKQLEPSYKFYLALSLLGVGESGRTVALLDEVISSNDQTFLLPSLWYQGLAYLRANKEKEAHRVLNQLLEHDNSTYHSRAKKILEKL
jgi:hypothetical protein